MSINVTVSGNPISIRNGKLTSNREFEKRRLIRLEQVRHQSKNIAENTRNKVKKASQDCGNSGDMRLKKWKARKLVDLQNQLNDVDDVSINLKSLEDVKEADEVYGKQQEMNRKIASERGRVASKKAQIEKNEKQLKEAEPLQRRNLSRDVENCRSANIICKERRQGRKISEDRGGDPLPEFSSSDSSNSEESFQPETVKDDVSKPLGMAFDKSVQTQPSELCIVESQKKGSVRDTRISDRIKRRTFSHTHLDNYDSVENVPEQIINHSISCKCCCCSNAQISPLKYHSMPVKNTNINKQNSEIPQGRKITLKSISRGPEIISKSVLDSIDINQSTLPSTKFQQKPPLTKKYTDRIPKSNEKSKIEAVLKNDLIISPTALVNNNNNNKENNDIETDNQRDIEAQLRGKRAMEQIKIKRDYEEMLKKLPMLQKQERVEKIASDQSRYHMSNERLEEVESKKQNLLDNVYEYLFSETVPQKQRQLVTIPEQIQTGNRISFETQPKNDFLRETNGRQEMENMKTLKALLEELKLQKSQLLKEINDLPKKKLAALIAAYTSHDSSEIEKSQNKKRKHDLEIVKDDRDNSNSISTSSSPRKKSKKDRSKQQQSNYTQTTPQISLAKDNSSNIQNDNNNNKENLCEIIIKITRDDLPEVDVIPAISDSQVKVITGEDNGSQKEKTGRVTEGSLSSTMTEKKANKKKSGLQKINDISASTSEDKQITNDASNWREQLSKESSLSTVSTAYLSPPNFQKPSSSITSQKKSNNKNIDPRLLTYIKKLLNMSQRSLDELQTSSISEVSTPSQSVVETPSNNPFSQLQSVISYFNLDLNEVGKQLSQLDSSDIHYNTPESSSQSLSSKSSADYNSNNKLVQYENIAESCNRKISDLTNMIAKVRAEKKHILKTSTTSSNVSSEFDTTTYLNLPQKSTKTTGSSGGDNDKNLLDIDYSYSQCLKKMSAEQLTVEKKTADSTNDEFLIQRLKILLSDHIKSKPSDTETDQIDNVSNIKTACIDYNVSVKKRPPPSKGLAIIQRINGELLGMPHELSTIIEADSQTKLDHDSQENQSPKKVMQVDQSKSNSSDDRSETEAMLESIGMKWAIPTLRKTREALAISSSTSSDDKSPSLREFLSRHLSSEKSTESSSSLEEIQKILSTNVNNQRTSTPVQGSERSERHVIFVEDSDISSVRDNSDMIHCDKDKSKEK